MMNINIHEVSYFCESFQLDVRLSNLIIDSNIFSSNKDTTVQPHLVYAHTRTYIRPVVCKDPTVL